MGQSRLAAFGGSMGLGTGIAIVVVLMPIALFFLPAGVLPTGVHSHKINNPGMFIWIVLFMLSAFGVVFMTSATYEHGLYGFTHLASAYITERPPSTHSFIQVFPFFACAALIAAGPILMFDRTSRGLLLFSFLAAMTMLMLCIVGQRLPEKLDEHGIFSRASVEGPQLMRIYGAKYFYYTRGRSWGVEVNPRHLVPHGPYIAVTPQTYYFVRSALYQAQVPPNLNGNGSWQSDFCLQFNVEKAGPYERIVLPHHPIRSDELVSCPKDAV